MADKFRQTFPIAVSFSEGELPTASKLTGLATQARSGQGLMQYALGDVWNQGGDSILTSSSTSPDGIRQNALMIPSLARYLGATKHTNPAIPELPNIEYYLFKFTGYAGEHEARLPFPLSDTAGTPDWTESTVGGYPTNPVASRSLVVATGDYHIDDSGNIFTYDALNVNWIIKYEPKVVGSVNADATWNVIPEWPVDGSYGFQGLKIKWKNGVNNADGYYIYLPPRMPRYNSGSSDRPAWYPDPSVNMSTSPTSERFFWQGGSATAPDSGTYADHYRYSLPKAITDSAAWGAGASLPVGLMYLWDPYNTGTIIEGVTFTALPSSPTKWAFFVPNGTNLDDWLDSDYGQTQYSASRLQSALHEPDDYPNNGLRLVTVGCDISQLVSSLVEQMLNHDHQSASSPVARPVPHQSLSGLFDPNGFTPQIDASKLAQDDHPQYLHRGGFAGTTTRDKFNNAMLGDMLIASSSASNNYINIAGDSRKLMFGGTGSTERGVIYYDSSHEKLVLSGRSNSAGRAGVTFGDPDVDSQSSLELECYNKNFYFKPTDNHADSNVYIDGTDVYIGTRSAYSDRVIAGRTDGSSSYYRGNPVYIQSNKNVDITCDASYDLNVYASRLELTKSGSYFVTQSHTEIFSAVCSWAPIMDFCVADNDWADFDDRPLMFAGEYESSTYFSMYVPWVAAGSFLECDVPGVTELGAAGNNGGDNVNSPAVSSSLALWTSDFPTGTLKRVWVQASYTGQTPLLFVPTVYKKTVGSSSSTGIGSAAITTTSSSAKTLINVTDTSMSRYDDYIYIYFACASLRFFDSSNFFNSRLRCNVGIQLEFTYSGVDAHR